MTYTPSGVANNDNKTYNSVNDTDVTNPLDQMMACIDDSMPMKYIIVTGGSLSGLGKGVTVCALGTSLRTLGLRVTAVKIDPYLNIDAGTMSPYEHGEVFVLDDGGEVDLDLGNYERAFGTSMTRSHNLTSGKIYSQITKAERRGDYLGKTVQMVPHVSDIIQKWLTDVSKIPINKESQKPHICLVEIGGTVGDIESAIYLEAMQQFKAKVGYQNFISCHLSYVPVIGCMNEQKTKLTQHSTKELFRVGLSPDFVLARCSHPLISSTKQKICVFCPVNQSHVISLHDVSDINEIPLLMADQNLPYSICEKLGISLKPPQPNGIHNNSQFSMSFVRNLVARQKKCSKIVNVGIVGKYTGLADTYFSVIKALEHSCLEAMVKLKVHWIESTELEKPEDDPDYKEAMKKMQTCDAIICPGGFGDRGIYGKSLSSRYCRKNKIPYLGICLGLHTSLIDIASDVLKLEDANSQEFKLDCKNPVIISMPEFNEEVKGGTMRLGSRPTYFNDTSSLAYKLYDQEKVIYERHRHRYEVNPKYIKMFEDSGVKFVGKDENGARMQVLELADHPYYVCIQFHPELKSRPTSPAPVFLGLILASQNQLQPRLEYNGGKLLSGQAFYGMGY